MGNNRSFEHGAPAWIDLETATGSVTASRFYCGLFGWRVMARHRPTMDRDPEGYWILQQDGLDIGGLQPSQRPMWTLHFRVTDADATTRVVAANGGTVMMYPMQVYDAGRLAQFIDPVGTRFAVWEPDCHTGFDLTDVPNSYTWSELTCRDTAKAVEFYQAVFGWEARPAAEDCHDPEALELYLPGSDQPVAGLCETDSRLPADTPSQWMIYFAVADVDALAARAVTLGGKVAAGPVDRSGGRVAVLSDPDGSVFSILQRP